MRGLTLVEVMITLAIGLIVTLGVLGIMGANRQNLRITESLSESQENARMAFELIARDVRQARDTSCGAVPVTNDLNANWWGRWWPIRGFAGGEATTAAGFGGGMGQRVAGTEALQLQGSGETRIIQTPWGGGATINLQTSVGGLTTGPIIVCGLQNASLHTITAGGGNSITVVPPVALPTSVIDPSNPPFQVSRLTAVTWYIGNNNGPVDEGGRSLFRASLQPNGTVTTEEILPGVVGMSMRYHATGAAAFVTSVAANPAAWATINAIDLTLTTESTQKNVTSDADPGSPLVGSDGRIRRDITHVISLRNTN